MKKNLIHVEELSSATEFCVLFNISGIPRYWRRNMKKFLTIVLLLISTIALVACADKGVDTELASPKNVAIADGVVTWSAVTGAEEYTVVVGTRSFTTTLTTFDLKTQNIMVGTHTVVVLAVKAGKSSLPSTSLSYVVVGANLEVVLDDVLAAIDPSYTTGMTEDDFDDEWDYKNYQSMLRLSTAYSTAAVNVGMSEDDAVGFFGDFYEMASSGMENVENVSDLMTQLQMFENNNMSPFATAYVLYELIKVAMEMNIEDQQEYILEQLDYLQNEESYIATLKTATSYVTAYNKFMSYTDESNVALAEEFFSATNSDLYYLTYLVRNIAEDYYYMGYSEYNYWYGDDEYVQMLVDVLGQALMANDTAYISSLMFNGIPALQSVYNNSSYYNWAVRDLERSQENVLVLIETLGALEDNEVVVVASLEVVIDFLMTFKNSLPQNVINLFDDLVETGELSMEEYFIIKDGVVGVLIDTLPSASDFAVLHTALFYVGGAVTGVDMSSYMTHATFLGELDYAFLDLFLALVDDMDQQTFEDIMAIAEQIQTEELVYDPWWDEYYYEYVTDGTKVIELAVYVLTYVDSFVTANQVKVDALNALLDDDSMEDLFALAMEQVKAQIASDPWMDEEEIELITNMIDDLVADYDHIKAGLAVFEEIGVGLIDKFIETEGAMFIKLFELQEIGEDPEAAIQLIEELLVMFAEYNSIFVAGMTQADIQLALRMIKVPLLFALAQENPDVDYSATFDTLLPFVANVISNLLTIEQQIVTVAKNMDLTAIILDPSYDNIGMGIAPALLQGADLVLTSSIELLIKQTVTIVIDNILKNAVIMDLHGMSLNDLNNLKTMLLDTLDDIFAEVHIVADYDFTNLTTAQETRIQELMEMIQGLLMFGGSSIS